MGMRADSAKRFSQWIVGYMAVGPATVAADIAWHLLPDKPAIQLMRDSSLLAHGAWMACGILAVITIVLLRVRPTHGYISLVVLTATYPPASFAVWHQSVALQYWLSLAAIALGTYGVFVDQGQASLERGKGAA